MSEARTLNAYRAAYQAYEEAPSYVTAKEVHRLASALAAISDDHQHRLDEADDIMADQVG